MNTKELIISLCSLMSVSGSERYSSEKLFELIGDRFDDHYTDSIGNHIFVKKCGLENAPRVLIDCHFDEIGMMVSKIHDGGFLSVASVGGIDAKLLPSSEVTIYGKEEIYGVFAATAPHLLTPETQGKVTPIDRLLIDTGYSKDELEEIVSVGTPVGFRHTYTELENDRLAGCSFDDKACGACAVEGISCVDADDMCCDVYFVFSTREEVALAGHTAAYSIDPDYALVLDVTHAYVPDMENKKFPTYGSGVALAISAVTNRGLTEMVQKMCDANGIKYTLKAAPGSTGTNANRIPVVRNGIPTVLVSLPIKNMHSANELLDLSDCREMARLVSEFIKCKEIAEVYSR